MSERREVPREWQERVFDMVQAWTDPGQIIASDIERWHRILGEARAAIRAEIVCDPRDDGRYADELAGLPPASTPDSPNPEATP